MPHENLHFGRSMISGVLPFAVSIVGLLSCAPGGSTGSDIDLVDLAVYPSQVSINPGQTQRFKAYGYTSLGDSVLALVNWSTSAGSVTSDGVYTPHTAAGEYLVIATHAQRTWLTDTAYVSVEPVAVALVISPRAKTLHIGDSADFTVVALSAADDTVEVDVTWSASGGVIEGRGEGSGVGHYESEVVGSHWIKAEADSGRLRDSVAVTVVDTPLPGEVVDLAVVGLTETALSLELTEVDDGLGDPANYAVRFAPSPISWGPAGGSEFVISGVEVGATLGFEVTGLASGTQYDVQCVAFRGTLNDGAVFSSQLSNVATGTTEGSTVPVASVTVTPSSVTLAVGDTRQLTAELRDADGNLLTGRSVTWSSGDSAVASVSTGGLVTAVSPGSTTITATSEGQSGNANISVTSPPPVGSVPQWGRQVISLTNSSYSGNPFELELDATFTHTASGTSLTLPAYYAGNDIWKFGFMPTLTGAWTYVTASSDPDLNGITGSIDCVPSTNRGLLKADQMIDSRKWRLADGTYVVPVALRIDFFYESASQAEFEAAADFMAANNLHLMDTRLQDEFTSTMQVFDGNWTNHEFNLTLWDQFEARMDALREHGLGAYVMFYADDAGQPDWSGQSDTEALLIRYVVARLAGYPMVLFDTGIDVGEYRSQTDVNWFGDQLRALDPYGHPVSSRQPPGYVMSSRTYDSQGDQHANINDMIGYFESYDLPIGMFDAWGENYSWSNDYKNFSPGDVRRSIWKAVIAGGLAVMYRGNDGYFHINDLESDLESEQWLRMVNPFIQQKLGTTFGRMVPAPELVSNGYCLADPDRSRILYFLIGVNDSWDSGNGGDITVELSGVSGSFSATWFDPRTGSETGAGILSGGSNHILSPPSTDDWILILTR